MRKTTEELWSKALSISPGSESVTETFRRLVIENERECAEAVAIVGELSPTTRKEVIGKGVAIGAYLFTFPPAAQVPEGWKLVPIEPTDVMCGAAYNDRITWNSGPRAIYQAMLAAAPEVK